MKNKKIFIAVLSVTLAVITLVSLLIIFIPKGNKPEIKLTENDIALKEYDFSELQNQQMTLRAPIMNVTKRNLNRPVARMLDNTYTLQGRTITFPSYPDNVHAIPQSYESTGSANYYKYMLLRQFMLTASDLSQKSANGTLTENDVYKHPASDNLFGEIPRQNNAVEKEITVDPIYRSMLTTGLYLPAGEMVTVKVSGLKAGESIAIRLNTQDTLGYASGVEDNYFAVNDERVRTGDVGNITIAPQYARQNLRIPYINMLFKFTENKEYKIASVLGGIMHIEPMNSTTYTKLIITGAVETPHYILGVTTEDYFDKYLKNSPGLIGVLDTENGQLVGPASYMRNSYEMQKLASIWHSFFTINESFTGGPYNEANKVYFDTHVPAGAAVALGNNTFACPSGWFATCMNYYNLLRYGTWGVLHEIGHSNGSAYGQVWGLAGERDGEVRNNALISLAYIKLLDMGTYKGSGVEHGAVVHPYTNLKMTINAAKNNAYTDFNNYEYFDALSVYVNLMHSFGPDNFYKLLYSYKTTPKYYDNKRADFIIRTSKQYNYDFRWYFNTLAKTNLSDDNFTSEDLKFLNTLTVYNPMASYYAGTVNGMKTGGDQIVTFGTDFEFKLKENFISYTDYEFLGVIKPKYGSLVKSTSNNTGSDNGNYIYKSPSKFVPKDSFSFNVKANGVVTKFTIDIRFEFTENTVSSYKNIAANNVDDAIILSKSLQPNSVEKTNVAGIDNYNSPNANELKKVSFKIKPTASGKHTFYLKADDQAILYMKQDNTFNQILKINSYTTGYSESNKYEVELVKDKVYEYELYNFNIKGVGFAKVGIRQPLNNSLVDISSPLLLSNNLTEADIKKIPDYREPNKFIVSNKSSVLNNKVLTNKKDWKVLSAPNHEKGDTYEYTETDAEGNIIKKETRNKTDWLIDGNTSTTFHSVWSVGTASPAPHTYVIDTKKIQDFNYYQINTVNSAQYYIKKYRLSISDNQSDYKTISEGENLKYDNGIATLNFATQTGRYLKLEVYTTTGNNGKGMFSVITEINAGNKAQNQVLYNPVGDKIFSTKKFTSSDTNTNLPKNILTTTNKDEKMVFKFKGESFSIFGITGENYGSAKVYIDGKLTDTIDANSTKTEYNKLLFYKDGLKNTTHTIEIITTERRNFAVSYLGLSYDAMLLTASNIYLERGLAISLTIFIILFAIALTFIILLYTNKKFRSFFGLNKKVETNKVKTPTSPNMPAKSQPQNITYKPTVQSSNAAKSGTQKIPSKAAPTKMTTQKVTPPTAIKPKK